MGQNKKEQYRIEIGGSRTHKSTGIESIGAYFVLFFFCILTIFGMLRTICTAFEIELNAPVLYGGLSVSCFLFILAFNDKKAGRILLPLILLTYISWWGMRFRELYSGLYLFAEAILKYANEHLGWSLHVPAPMYQVERSDMAEGVLILYITISFFLCWGIFFRAGRLITSVLCVTSLVIPFAFGEVPDAASMVMIISGIAGIYAMRKREGKILLHTGTAAVVILALSGVLGTVLLAPAIKKPFEKADVFKEQILSFLESPEIGGITTVRKGGVGDGDLKGGRFLEDSRPQLEVTVSRMPEEALYLQGYIGVMYQQNRWTPIAKSQTGTMDGAEGKKIKNQLFTQYSNSGEAADTMSIKVVGANDAYKYVPYGAQYTDEDQLLGDTYIKGPKNKEYEVSYTAMPEASVLGSELDEDDRFILDTDYGLYVWERYLSVPQGTRQAFDTIVEEYKAEQTKGYSQYIRQKLSEQTTYSLEPGTVPAGKDYAEYFFFENKKGYCMHYATTATLLLRMEGLPARFVAGYVVRPEQFREQEDGSYKATVTGNSAHAWAEVYSERFGWLPLETTPGYVSANEQPQIPDEKEETAAAPPVQEEAIKQPENQEKAALPEDTKETAPKKPQEKKTENAASGRGGVIVLFALAAGGTCAIFIQCKKRRNKRKRPNERAIEIFHRLYAILVIAGMEDSKFDTEHVCQEIVKVCPWLKLEAEETLASVMKANFSGGQIKREEYDRIRQVYQEVYRNVWQEASVFQRIAIMCKVR